MGPPLFRTDPVCLDMRQCLRKVTLGQAFRQHVLPADPGEAIGTFDDKDFGVFPHTSVHIPVYASYPALPRRTQDSVTTAMPLAWWAGFHAGLDRVQLSERTPAFLTPAHKDAPHLKPVLQLGGPLLRTVRPAASSRFAALAPASRRLACSYGGQSCPPPFGPAVAVRARSRRAQSVGQ
jgi:hypothetical protein